MNIYIVYGLRRSGNHAILEWLLYNFSQENRISDNANYVLRGDSCYINDFLFVKRTGLKSILSKFKNLNNIIIGCEESESLSVDMPHYIIGNVIKEIVIIRDIPSIIASRLKRVETNPEIKHLMSTDERFFSNWKHYASNNTIKFEDWLTKKECRDNLCLDLGIENLDNVSYVSRIGGGSSFVGTKLDSVENILNRESQIQIPSDLIERINAKDIADTRKSVGYI